MANIIAMTADDNTAKGQSRLSQGIYALAGMAFAVAVAFALKNYPELFQRHFRIAGIIAVCLSSVIAALPYRSGAMVFEFSTIIITWLIFWDNNPANLPYLYLPLIVATVIAAYKREADEPRFFVIFIIWALTAALWDYLVDGVMPANTVQHIMFWSTAAMLLIHTLSLFSAKRKKLARIDLILCSYSGNTAHYAEPFIAGARQSGAEVIVHRYHYYKEFKPELSGDGLVVAFPVMGWKPPWPMFNYLIFDLPRGKGKPAYIMYSSAGGPENAGVLIWLILTLKGYRVTGRSWAAYPINVSTFRLGLKRVWAAIDKVVPHPKDADAQARCGRDFADGQSAGLPFIFWPSPLFIFGILIDNKLIDSLIYRNHVYKKRCNQCGICVDYCPAQRLKMADGYPKSSGACVLCTCCVNLCPKRAMNIWFFTEYGNPYHPRWRELVVRGKDTKGDCRLQTMDKQ
ncbi:MAG: hypothetical protein V1701_12260 [Planctomycetota bacterium]